MSKESTSQLPLSGVTVIEFSHMVMGPAAGLVLADLGAEVIRVEPINGDKTRELKGSGSGYFAMYNRNKKAICLNLKSTDGLRAAKRLIEKADVLIENFRPGAMQKLGLDYESLSAGNPRLIYCSTHGFLNGPYQSRTALDEVAQMMGGLAYMTGPPGQPLRAGASVIDVMGGMFGSIGVVAALQQRHSTGRGQHIKSSLFESTVFLVGQHMAQYAVTGEAAAPMPARVSAWAIYDVFVTADDEKVFVGVVSDAQWISFCEAFDLNDFLRDSSLRENNERVAKRDVIMPVVQDVFRRISASELMRGLEACGLPFAPISRPEDLFEDPHLLESGGLLRTKLPNGASVDLPALPIEVDGAKLAARLNPPRVGEHTADVLRELGYSAEEVEALFNTGAASGN